MPSCEQAMEDDIFQRESLIWIDGVVGTDDSVKVYLGTTSGMNSGDLADYRDDATVKLFINNTTIPVILDYKKVSENSSKGFYFYPRLGFVKPGDSLSIFASIENSGFKPIQAKTIFPEAVQIGGAEIQCQTNPYSKQKHIDLKLLLDTNTIKTSTFFEIVLQNKKLSKPDGEKETVYSTELINSLNNISLSPGLYWNEKLKSTFVNYTKVEDEQINIEFDIQDDSYKNEIEIELKTISVEYFDYCKALDSGNLGTSNVTNGSGIFTGFSRIRKSIPIKE